VRFGRRPAVRFVLVVTIAAAAAGAAVAASRSPLFRLRHVDVVGISKLSRADVLRLAGVSSTTNVLWFDASEVARRLESDPWIAQATVSRRAPWTIRITVVERRPVAIVKAEPGYTVVSSDGVALGTVSADPGLPVIVLPHPAPGAAPSFGGAARAIAGLRGCAGCRVLQAVVATDGTLTVELSSGIRVAYGDSSEIRVKTAVVKQIIRWARARRASLTGIDVSAPATPAATFA
jgi:cell division protein FtsQ